ncbi:hypothetical protein [Euzebya tangerina]|uniref:hypothetical protein n=1 Tax=Euzebya tangerina TaxID=591198 RepID=UPI002F314D8E
MVDAPPTGRIVNFLAAPEATTDLVNVGPVRQQAATVIDMLTDADRTAVLLTTLLEEMPVTETVDSIAALTDLSVPLGPILVNRVAQPAMDDKALKVALEMTDADVTATLDGIVDVTGGVAEQLLELASKHQSRLDLQDRMRGRLAEEADLPVVELPFVATATRSLDVATGISQRITEVTDG